MKTDFVIPGVPPELCADAEEGLTAALDATVVTRIERARAQFMRGRTGFTPGYQPRDSTGKFREILARLKYNIGDTELDNVVAEIKRADDGAAVGDYHKATVAGQNVIKLVDDIDRGVLDPKAIANVREGAKELGRVLAYLPLPKGDPNAKVRFSDLPPSTAKLVQSMITRVESKIGVEDAANVVAKLKSYISGVRSMASDELSAELNRLLRLLT